MTWEREALVRLLDGTGAHVQTSAALDALTEEQAAFCPDPWPHSCHRILLHVVYWQDLFLARLEDDPAPFPETAAMGWPEPGRNRWTDTLGRFRRGLKSAKERARRVDLEDRVPAWRGIQQGEGLAILAQHNSYHLGQIVLLRRILDAWPPPAGGDTW